MCKHFVVVGILVTSYFCGHPTFVVCSCLEYYSEVIAILQMFSVPLCCCVVAERVGETFGPAPLLEAICVSRQGRLCRVRVNRNFVCKRGGGHSPYM